MPEPPTPEPVPAELRILAAEADALAERTAEMAARLEAADDGHLQRLAQPMNKATGDLADYTGEIARTAAYLTRVRVSRDPRLCDVPWGICPLHGVTLHSFRDRAWCTATGCGNSWEYDRLHTPCTEPAVAIATDRDDVTGSLCSAHASDAGRRLDGCSVEYLDHRAANS
ncbi:hypothetical protein CFP71_15030 [Amycolatopsis thailandensis]|uniref:Uncharacterized protein n=1 Tax=Amycolatopsis thailandensis TaxID=589330 RepID=A0A229SB16_9PSEU|nr:hypothetical protein [Amycolatopsis thailandensis]OXM56132.1 hypothetical protein CFP71_15030 [Amycolatopsis thailandensis]